jgi:hypothetical protein
MSLKHVHRIHNEALKNIKIPYNETDWHTKDIEWHYYYMILL